ncbi:MAG: hypothetical protein V4787_14905 [Pseudomonadota bacterium]
MTVNRAPSISIVQVPGQPAVHGMGLFKYAFKGAGVGGNPVSQHAAGYAQRQNAHTTFAKQVVPYGDLIDKRKMAMEKKADACRKNVAKILLSEHPNSFMNLVKLRSNFRKMEKTGLEWNYTATKDFGDDGARQAQALLQGLKLVTDTEGVTTPHATSAMGKLQDELKTASQTDVEIDREQLTDASNEMQEAQEAFDSADPANNADEKSALDDAIQRHAAAKARFGERGRHVTFSNMQRATEVGKKLVGQLANMDGKTPEQKQASRRELKDLMRLAETADSCRDVNGLLTVRPTNYLDEQVGHLLALQKPGGNAHALKAELYAAFLYGVVMAAGDRESFPVERDVAKVLDKLPEAVSNSVLEKLARWREPEVPAAAAADADAAAQPAAPVNPNAAAAAAAQPVVPGNPIGNAAAQPAVAPPHRMSDTAGAHRGPLGQIASQFAVAAIKDTTTTFDLIAPSLKGLLQVPIADWGDAKCVFNRANGNTDEIDFKAMFDADVKATGITDPADVKALHAHMTAEWVKKVLTELDLCDANGAPPNAYLRHLNMTERAALRARAELTIAGVAPPSVAAARIEALKRELGGRAEFAGHSIVENDPNKFHAVAQSLVALEGRTPNELGSTVFPAVNGTIAGATFQFDFKKYFQSYFVEKGIDPASAEGVEMQNYLAARWIQGMLDHLVSVEKVEPRKFGDKLTDTQRSTIRSVADVAAPRPVAQPTPGVPLDWAAQLAEVEASTRTVLRRDMPDSPTNTILASDLEVMAQGLAQELALLSAAPRNQLGSVPGAAKITAWIDTYMQRAAMPINSDPDLISAMRADIGATLVKVLVGEFSALRRRNAAGKVKYEVTPALDELPTPVMQKLYALAFEPNLKPESAWKRKLEDTRKLAKEYMAKLDGLDAFKAATSLDEVVTLLTAVSAAGTMPWPLPEHNYFDLYIDDLLPAGAPFDQVEPMSKHLAAAYLREVLKEIETRENLNPPPGYFGNRTTAFGDVSRQAIRSLSIGGDHTDHMVANLGVVGWTVNLALARTAATKYWNDLKLEVDAMTQARLLGDELELLSTTKRNEMHDATKAIGNFDLLIHRCLPRPLPDKPDLDKRMRDDLAAEFLRQLATDINNDASAIAHAVSDNRPVGVLTSLMNLRADTSLL